jgi:hypothetical protein
LLGVHIRIEVTPGGTGVSFHVDNEVQRQIFQAAIDLAIECEDPEETIEKYRAALVEVAPPTNLSMTRQTPPKANRWDASVDKGVIDAAVDTFIDELVEVCRRHNMTLGHEDAHGAFQVKRGFNEDRADWLRAAHIAKDKR